MEKASGYERAVFYLTVALCAVLSAIHPLHSSSHEAADLVAWIASFAVGPLGLLLLYGAIHGKLRKEAMFALVVIIWIVMWTHDNNMDWFKYTALPK